VLVTTDEYRTCDAYCADQEDGLLCVGAFEEMRDQCKYAQSYECNQDVFKLTFDMLCQCTRPGSYTPLGVGYCMGNRKARVNQMQKYSITESYCKAMCTSLSSCVGYAFGGYCSVYGSMTSASSGWNYYSAPTTTISEASGNSGYSCYLKNQVYDCTDGLYCADHISGGLTYDGGESKVKAACDADSSCLMYDYHIMDTYGHLCSSLSHKSFSGFKTCRKKETAQYDCQSGQGQLKRFKKRTSDNSKSACAMLCDITPGCVGFDYTTMSSSDACRTYEANTPRIGNGGAHNRQYCARRSTIGCKTHVISPGSENGTKLFLPPGKVTIVASGSAKIEGSFSKSYQKDCTRLASPDGLPKCRITPFGHPWMSLFLDYSPISRWLGQLIGSKREVDNGLVGRFAWLRVATIPVPNSKFYGEFNVQVCSDGFEPKAVCPNTKDSLICKDGTEFAMSTARRSTAVPAASGWGNCDSHGGRKQCPSSWPFMCNKIQTLEGYYTDDRNCCNTKACCNVMEGVFDQCAKTPETTAIPVSETTAIKGLCSKGPSETIKGPSEINTNKYYLSYVGGCPTKNLRIDSKEECEGAAEELNLSDIKAHGTVDYSSRPQGCYVKAEKCQLVFNKGGILYPTDPLRPVICRGIHNKNEMFDPLWKVEKKTSNPMLSKIEVGLEPGVEPAIQASRIEISWGVEPLIDQHGGLVIQVFGLQQRIIAQHYLTFFEIVRNAEELLVVDPATSTLTGVYELYLESEIELKFIFHEFHFHGYKAQPMFSIRPRLLVPFPENPYIDSPGYPPFLQKPNHGHGYVPGWFFLIFSGLILTFCALAFFLYRQRKREPSNDYRNIILEEQFNRNNFSSREL